MQQSVCISEKSCLVETKKDKLVDEEFLAVRLTSGKDDGRPNRTQADFVLHDENGVPPLLEMLEFDDMFISGLILLLEESSDREKEKVIRCEGFGCLESWGIFGYEDGSPVIWLSTNIADYHCLRLSSSYKKFYDHFFDKDHACLEVYKRLSRSSKGNPNSTLDELLTRVVHLMSGNKHFFPQIFFFESFPKYLEQLKRM